MNGTVKDIFYDITKQLIQLDDINTSIMYIDGTKIEANARKNSFVWKKAIVNYQKKTFIKLSEFMPIINMTYQTSYPIKESYRAIEIGEIADVLMKKMTNEGIEVVYGIGHKKSGIQKDYENILDCYTKLLRYEESLEIMGERNSYCKTDHDATMMNMKYDYYNQTGVFKPGYNLQIGVSDSYIVHIDIYPNPTDTKTYIPFMKAYKERYGFYPKWPIGDAGYGSYDNLMFNIMNKIELGLKYNYYAKKNESKFKKQIYNPLNWKEDNQGLKVCPDGHHFDQRLEDKWNDKGEYLQISQMFECRKCHSCIHKSKCTKGGKTNTC